MALLVSLMIWIHLICVIVCIGTICFVVWVVLMHGTPFFTRFFVLSFMGFESPMLHLNVTKKKPLLSSSGFFEVFVYINQ